MAGYCYRRPRCDPWKRTLNNQTVEIATTLYVDLTEDESKALDGETEQYARFVERKAMLL